MEGYQRGRRAHLPLTRRYMFAGLALLGLLSGAPRAVQAELLFGLTTDNRLLSFDSVAPGVLLNNVSITGIQSGESVLGIDVRPTTGALYGIGSTNRIYVFDAISGVVISSTAMTGAGLIGNSFGVDFNPVTDSAGLASLRVVSEADQNLRVNVDTGAVTVDGMLRAGSPLGSVNPTIGGSAYSNNVRGSKSTTLYNIDFNFDRLVIQSPENDGNLARVGELGPLGTPPRGADLTSELVGFDISGASGVAYASLTAPGSFNSQLYTINLSNGAAILVGRIGASESLRGLAVSAVPEPSSLAMLSLGLVSVIGFSKRRRDKSV